MVIAETYTEGIMSQISKFWLCFEVRLSGSWKMQFSSNFNGNFERNGYKIRTEQKLQKMRHPSLCIDLSPAFVRFGGLRSNIVDKSSLQNHFVQFFRFFFLTSYTLLGGYSFDAQCISHQKTFQAIYTLYRMNGQIREGWWRNWLKKINPISHLEDARKGFEMLHRSASNFNIWCLILYLWLNEQYSYDSFFAVSRCILFSKRGHVLQKWLRFTNNGSGLAPQCWSKLFHTEYVYFLLMGTGHNSFLERKEDLQQYGARIAQKQHIIYLFPGANRVGGGFRGAIEPPSSSFLWGFCI